MQNEYVLLVVLEDDSIWNNMDDISISKLSLSSFSLFFSVSVACPHLHGLYLMFRSVDLQSVCNQIMIIPYKEIICAVHPR